MPLSQLLGTGALQRGGPPSRPWSWRAGGTPRSPPCRPSWRRCPRCGRGTSWCGARPCRCVGCITWRSTRTVTVLSILSLTTLPVSWRWFLAAASVIWRSLSLLGEHGVHARDLALHALDLAVLGEALGGQLHAQAELRLAQLQQLLVQLFHALAAQFARFHVVVLLQPIMRCTNAVRIGSFAAASAKASRAIVSSTPSIS